MSCDCCLCKAREMNCHPWEIYFAGKLEAELVKANPHCPIYVYKQFADYVATGASKEWAVNEIKDYHKRMEQNRQVLEKTI